MAYDEHLADRIREAMQGEQKLTEQKMFGGLGFMVGGHMAVAASSQGGLLLRCDPDETEALAARPGAAPFVMRGKEMSGWLRVEADAVETDEALRVWVDRGVSYARSLPAK